MEEALAEQGEKPDAIQDTSEEMHQQLYLNTAAILCELLLIPVTNTSVEQSNSSLKITSTLNNG